jgi:hypothetical protein
MEAGALRRYLSRLPYSILDSVLVLGDFNREAAPFDDLLTDLWSKTEWEDGVGSYAYRGRWQRPDRVLLSPALLGDTGVTYRPATFRVFAPSFMIDPLTGFPMRHGDRGWHYSDHLPLVLELSVGGGAAARSPFCGLIRSAIQWGE